MHRPDTPTNCKDACEQLDIDIISLANEEPEAERSQQWHSKYRNRDEKNDFLLGIEKVPWDEFFLFFDYWEKKGDNLLNATFENIIRCSL